MARLLLICAFLLLSVANVCCTDASSNSSIPTPSSTAPHTTPSSSSTSSTATQSSFVLLPTAAPNASYTIRNGSGDVCVKMNASIQFVVEYRNKSGSLIQVPLAVQNATENGSCSSSLDNITLQWSYPFDSSTLYNITFTMLADESGDQWNMSNITAEININNTIFNNYSAPAIPLVQKYLVANYSNLVPYLDFTRSYQCISNMAYNMTVLPPANKTYNVTLNLANFQIQAFQFSPSNISQYGKALSCPADMKGSKIVPIAVGAALAGLVIIVIVAYVIGRFRSRKQNSYEALS